MLWTIAHFPLLNWILRLSILARSLLLIRLVKLQLRVEPKWNNLEYVNLNKHNNVNSDQAIPGQWRSFEHAIGGVNNMFTCSAKHLFADIIIILKSHIHFSYRAGRTWITCLRVENIRRGYAGKNTLTVTWNVNPLTDYMSRDKMYLHGYCAWSNWYSSVGWTWKVSAYVTQHAHAPVFFIQILPKAGNCGLWIEDTTNSSISIFFIGTLA